MFLAAVAGRSGAVQAVSCAMAGISSASNGQDTAAITRNNMMVKDLKSREFWHYDDQATMIRLNRSGTMIGYDDQVTMLSVADEPVT